MSSFATISAGNQLPPLPQFASDEIQARFETFHQSNPEVYTQLVRLARELKAKGYSRYSIDALCHVVRWDMALKTDGNDGYKLNDHWTSRYARLIMASEPDLAGFFKVKPLRSED